MDAMLLVEMQNTVHRVQRDGLRLRGEGGRLAERAAEAAAARRKKNANRNAPASGQAELRDQRRMLNFIESAAEPLSDGLFAVADKHVVEGGSDGRCQRAVVSGPHLRDACGARLLSHAQDFVGFLEVKGKAHGVPATAELRLSIRIERGYSKMEMPGAF